VNPTETQEDEEPKMEVIFYNKALMKILDDVTDLSKFIEKNVFHT